MHGWFPVQKWSDKAKLSLSLASLLVCSYSLDRWPLNFTITWSQLLKLKAVHTQDSEIEVEINFRKLL